MICVVCLVSVAASMSSVIAIVAMTMGGIFGRGIRAIQMRTYVADVSLVLMICITKCVPLSLSAAALYAILIEASPGHGPIGVRPLLQ